MVDPSASPLRILWLIKGLGPGGAERLLVSIARVNDPSRVRLDVAYVLPWKDHLVPDLEAASVRTHLLGGARGLADPRWVLRLRRLLASGHYDIVHVHSPAVAAVVRLLVRTLRRRPKVLTTEHNLWSSHGRATRLANALSHRLGDGHLAVSAEVRASMWPSLQASSTVMVHGVPLTELAARRPERAAARAELGLGADDVAIVSVANLRANKDHETLLQAAVEVLRRDARARFLAVGQGPLAEELQRRAHALGLDERFQFLGYQQDPVRILLGSDIFTLSSRHEGLPIALLEAMSVGLPAVVTAVGGVPSVVQDGVQARLVPAGRPDLLAEGLLSLTADAAERARLGAAAAVRVADFDIEVSARRIEEVYASLMGASSDR